MANRTMSNQDYLQVDAPALAIETTTVTHQGISWASVAAGVIIAIILQIALNVLGLSIGANTINPIREVNPVEPSFGTATVLWLAGSMIISLFAGGWVAAHLSGTSDHVNGLLHGLVMWGTGALVTIILLTTGAGNLISGAAGAVGQGISLLGEGAVSAVPAVADGLNLRGLTSETITSELQGLTTAARERAAAEANAASGAPAADGTPPDSAISAFSSLEDLEFNTIVSRFLTGDQEDTAAREEVVTLLTERTGLTVEEANAQLDRWTSALNTVRDDAEATAREVGQQLTDTLTVVAGALFVTLLLGAFSAGVGGMVGAHDELVVESTTVTR